MEIQKTTDTGIMSKRKVLEELSRSAASLERMDRWGFRFLKEDSNLKCHLSISFTDAAWPAELIQQFAFCERINKMVDDCTVFQKDERTKLFQVQMKNHWSLYLHSWLFLVDWNNSSIFCVFATVLTSTLSCGYAKVFFQTEKSLNSGLHKLYILASLMLLSQSF